MKPPRAGGAPAIDEGGVLVDLVLALPRCTEMGSPARTPAEFPAEAGGVPTPCACDCDWLWIIGGAGEWKPPKNGNDLAIDLHPTREARSTSNVSHRHRGGVVADGASTSTWQKSRQHR